ncbi:MAG: hypothetical protein J6U40_04900 [Kiritimatiellae bacterium]|nr:hypothetical protein [Kiritimatiellia bacterium]
MPLPAPCPTGHRADPGFELKRGAIASSVSHDAHSIIAVVPPTNPWRRRSTR